MNKDEILDDLNESAPAIDRWRLALLATIILTVGLFITLLLRNYISMMLTQYIPMIFALHFFIKRINYKDLKIGELFLWSTGIFFVGYFINNIMTIVIAQNSSYYTIQFLLFSTLGVLFRSIILGNMLLIGVFNFIKHGNLAMLVLMVFLSLLGTSMFTEIGAGL